MQFIDQANIILKAGKGGNGIVSFRREKFVPAGGPSGGNGGRGGSVILMADNNLQTLLDFKFKREIIAEDGCKGGPNKRSGASGEDRILKVPCGTEIMPVLISLISVPQGTLRIVSSPEAPDLLLGPPLLPSSAIISRLNLKSNNVWRLLSAIKITEPPLPPFPPEGPPAGTNFSLLNETIPFPPFPALRIMFA